jgi:hypothetical protein
MNVKVKIRRNCLLGCKPNKVNSAMNKKSKNNPEIIKNKSGHASIRSQKSNIGHLRVHQYRHH